MGTGSEGLTEAAQMASMWADVSTMHWARWAAWAAWAAVAMNSFGLVLLYSQLRANGAAIKAASASAQAAADAVAISRIETRPWIEISTPDAEAVIHHYGDGQPPAITLVLRAENVGRTPAVNVSLKLEAVKDANQARIERIAQEILPLNDQAGPTIFPGRHHEVSFQLPFMEADDNEKGYIIAVAAYSAPGSVERLATSVLVTAVKGSALDRANRIYGPGTGTTLYSARVVAGGHQPFHPT